MKSRLCSEAAPVHSAISGTYPERWGGPCWLLYVTEAKGNSRSTYERGPSLVGSLGGSLCRYKRFCPALASLIGPVPNIFLLRTLPISLHLNQSASPCMCLSWYLIKKFWIARKKFPCESFPNNSRNLRKLLGTYFYTPEKIQAYTKFSDGFWRNSLFI